MGRHCGAWTSQHAWTPNLLLRERLAEGLFANAIGSPWPRSFWIGKLSCTPMEREPTRCQCRASCMTTLSTRRRRLSLEARLRGSSLGTQRCGHTPYPMVRNWKWKPALRLLISFLAISGPIWSMSQEWLDLPFWLGRLELRSGPISMESRTHGSLPHLCRETCVARSTSHRSRQKIKKKFLHRCQHDLLPTWLMQLN